METLTNNVPIDANNKLKNNNALGMSTDNISTELYKCGGPSLWKKVHKLITYTIYILVNEELPTIWRTGRALFTKRVINLIATTKGVLYF